MGWLGWPKLKHPRPKEVPLVTRGQFAEFIRQGRYAGMRSEYNQFNWPVAWGGDAVLRRLGYGEETRDYTATSVTWVEAHAYCLWKKGRLPTEEELSEGLVLPSLPLAGDAGAWEVTAEWCEGDLTRGEPEKPVHDGRGAQPRDATWSAPHLGFRCIP
ncbi:MAG: SUMF1/EgtB/PvdO family nonheme iron enzyme [Proteobacteria bacterium]|nr:SUMF1/EgtB/PvdO family nonheme iron enzyme [Pseudomonadota bacterium]